MPYMDGIELVRAIYKIDKLQKIIIISAHDESKYLLPLVKIGVEGFIQKPFTLDTILEVLNDIYLDNSVFVLTNNCTYDLKSNKLLIKTINISLTANEIRVMQLFLINKNRYFSLDKIHLHIFFNQPLKEYSEHSIRGIIRRLKAKLPKNLIINNKTQGYRLDIK